MGGFMTDYIFDIETAGHDWESLDKETQEYFIKRNDGEEKAKDMLGLNSITAKVIVISMLDIQRKEIFTYYENLDNRLFDNEVSREMEGYKVHYRMGDERYILASFWERIAQSKKFVTFNGRGFDCPFILHRSMIHKIKPTRNLMTNRYYKDEHVDLYDLLTYYNAYKGYSLDMWCRALNVFNSKQGEVKGSEVGAYYREGKIMEIAEYCSRDVIATKELYDRVREYI